MSTDSLRSFDLGLGGYLVLSLANDEITYDALDSLTRNALYKFSNSIGLGFPGLMATPVMRERIRRFVLRKHKVGATHIGESHGFGIAKWLNA